MRDPTEDYPRAVPVETPRKSEATPTEVPHNPSLILLDLDNTLIPTDWIMETWKHSRSPMQALEAIKMQLKEARLIEAIRDLFVSVRELFVKNKKRIGKIFIVTNAQDETVKSFYLELCLPELGTIINQEEIEIRSTEHITKDHRNKVPFLGEHSYKEYYTAVKFHEFVHCLDSFCQSIQVPGGATKKAEITRGADYVKRLVTTGSLSDKIDLISAGDQACEIMGACHLSYYFADVINRTKLLFVADTSDKKNLKQHPVRFVQQIRALNEELLDMLNKDTEILDASSRPSWEVRNNFVQVAQAAPIRFEDPKMSLLQLMQCNICTEKIAAVAAKNKSQARTSRSSTSKKSSSKHAPVSTQENSPEQTEQKHSSKSSKSHSHNSHNSHTAHTSHASNTGHTSHTKSQPATTSTSTSAQQNPTKSGSSSKVPSEKANKASARAYKEKVGNTVRKNILVGQEAGNMSN